MWLLRKAFVYRHHGSSRNRPRHWFTIKNRGRRLATTSSEMTKVNPEKTKFKTDYSTKGQWVPSSHEGLIFISLTVNNHVAFFPNSVKGSSLTEKQLPPKGNML